MNKSKARHFFRHAGLLALLAAALLAPGGVRAANEREQPGRFLLIFETSPTLKKNLPAVGGTLSALFSSNFQNEINSYDDVAVWTVDESLHTGTFPLANWSPEDAEMYHERLTGFLGHQKFSRHASLTAIQPLLNRVAKNSDRLTVLIFCDSQSQLSGTPYDAGVNEIMTNATTRVKDSQTAFVLVLRSYHGQYLGGSVNHPGRLNFPAFPAPPKPTPPPVAKAAPASIVAPGSGPAVTPVPALIIVGTNATTNTSLSIKPAATPAATPASPPPVRVPAPVPVPTATTAMVPPTPPPSTPVPAVVTAPPATAPPVNVAPVSTTPPPTSPPVVTATAPVQTPPPEPPVVPPPAAIEPASMPGPLASNAPATVVEKTPAETGYSWPLLIGGGSLVAAAGLVIWLVTRSRRPQGSPITSSMRDDPRLPPRK